MSRILRLAGALLAVAAPASQLRAEQIAGLTLDQRIVTFDSSNVGAIATSSLITGLVGNDILTGIDLRPSNSLIYGIAGSGRIYSISLGGAATLVSTTSTSLSGSRFGVDFNPVPDRLRVISDSDQNLRINVDTGAATVDTVITSATGAAIDLIGSAYTNSVPGGPAPMMTTIYGIDSVSDALMISAAPNGGVYSTVGALGFDISNANQVGFDISGRTGAAYLNVDNAFYTINLGTGVASSVGTIAGTSLIGITATGAVPEPASWAMMVVGFGVSGMAIRRSRRTPKRALA